MIHKIDCSIRVFRSFAKFLCEKFSYANNETKANCSSYTCMLACMTYMNLFDWDCINYKKAHVDNTLKTS